MKNAIIGGVVGLLFMGGGFYFGLKLHPLPAPPAPVVAAAPVAVAKDKVMMPPPGVPITVDALRKTSESMMSLNEALQAREQAVALREQKAQQREDELAAERAALDKSHEKFKELYNEFQSRLQLVEASQVAQLQKQADLYTSMGTTQSIDLIREMDDTAMVRLFSVMDTKPLGKMIAEWKTKYPQDVPRIMHNLDGMAQVMPKEKIALNTQDTAAPAAAPDASAPAAPAPDAAAPDPNAAAPAPDATPAPAATPDPSAAPSAAPAAPADATPAAPTTDSSATPASTASSN
jgi:hypothetical protein